MGFRTQVGILVLTCIALSLGQQCPDQERGNCDPGPDCLNWCNKWNGCPPDSCFNCCDSVSFVTQDKRCDGVEDCPNGSDEKYGCPNYATNYFELGAIQCLALKEECKDNSECCSESCKDGKCWSEICG